MLKRSVYVDVRGCEDALRQRSLMCTKVVRVQFQDNVDLVLTSLSVSFLARSHLFRPRPWVRRIGDCIMRRDGLSPFGFASFFIRHSPEKSAELAKLGHGRVPLEAFDLVLAALPAALRKRVRGRHIYLYMY